MKDKVNLKFAKKAQTKKDKKNRKLIKRIDKIINKIEKQITALHVTTQKLQTLRIAIEPVKKEKAA